jgi:hypothetical protein
VGQGIARAPAAYYFLNRPSATATGKRIVYFNPQQTSSSALFWYLYELSALIALAR